MVKIMNINSRNKQETSVYAVRPKRLWTDFLKSKTIEEEIYFFIQNKLH